MLAGPLTSARSRYLRGVRVGECGVIFHFRKKEGEKKEKPQMDANAQIADVNCAQCGALNIIPRYVYYPLPRAITEHTVC